MIELWDDIDEEEELDDLPYLDEEELDREAQEALRRLLEGQ